MAKFITAVSLFFFIGMNSSAFAAPANTLAGLYACEAITNQAAQLACFKSETAKLRAAETSGDFVTIDKQAAEEIERDSYGFNLPSLPKLKIFGTKDGADKSKPLKSRALAINRTSTIGKGYLRFHLENGQVWDQTQPARVRHLGKESPDMLVIKNAALGSFMARVNGKGPKVRVRRIK